MKKCVKCKIGRYQLKPVPFVEWYNESILIIPDILTEHCDICNHANHDNVVVGSTKTIYQAPYTEKAQSTDAQLELLQQILLNWQKTQQTSRGVN